MPRLHDFEANRGKEGGLNIGFGELHGHTRWVNWVARVVFTGSPNRGWSTSDKLQMCVK